MFKKVDQIWKIMNTCDDVEIKAVLCTLIDAVAGRENRTGYEMMTEVLPIMKDIANSFGVAGASEMESYADNETAKNEDDALVPIEDLLF